MKPPILLDFPESFETRRLLMRAPRPGDGAEVNAAILETWDDLSAWMDWAKEKPPVEETEARVRRQRAAFLTREDFSLYLYEKGTNLFVGCLGLHPRDWDVPSFEIGYWCRKRFQGQGYIKEAVRGLVTFAFETLGARRVWLTCDAQNVRSRWVAERVGFKLEGEMRNERLTPDGKLRNTTVYAMIPEEYEEKYR